MRLIDADELIVIEYGGIKFVPKEFIDDAPTIDAEPVVRCKDCKYRKVSEYHYKGIGYRSTDCTRGNEVVIGTCEDDGYCSLAERKAEP